ncbi:zinc finger protein 10 isoform 2-T2 [Lycaon pictus]
MEAESLTAQSRTLVTFKDILVNFTREEWKLLDSSQQIMYKDVMLENYKNLISLGHQLPKPDVILQLEKGEEPWLVERVIHRETHPDLETAVEIKSSISKEVWKCEDELDKYQENQERHLRHTVRERGRDIGRGRSRLHALGARRGIRSRVSRITPWAKDFIYS